MTIELFHEAGASEEEIKDAEREAKKEALRRSMGISKEEFDELFEEAKQFFELRKKEVLGR